MNNNILFRVKSASLVALALVFVSCGRQSSRVQDVNVVSKYIDSEVHLGFDLQFKTDNIIIQDVTIPILNPKGWDEIGTFSMNSVLGGSTLLALDINLSAIEDDIQAAVGSLPNGQMLPLIANHKTISIPVQDKVVIYITFGDGVAAIGLAANIKGMDQIGRSVGTSKLFVPFNIKDVLGSAGIYTSSTSGANGIGFFADLTQVLEPVMFIDLGVATPPVEYQSLAMMILSNGKSGLTYKSDYTREDLNLKQLSANYTEPSRRKKRRLASKLNYLNNRHAYLEVE